MLLPGADRVKKVAGNRRANVLPGSMIQLDTQKCTWRQGAIRSFAFGIVLTMQRSGTKQADPE